MSERNPASIPRGVLVGAGTLLTFTVITAGAARLTGISQDPPVSKPIMTRDLRFEDRPNGGIAVYDAKDAKPIDVIAPESNGFIRGTLRAMVRKRRLAGVDNVDFRLTAWADGRLTLDEPAGGGLIELAAFGHTNEAAFARLLTLGRVTR